MKSYCQAKILLGARRLGADTICTFAVYPLRSSEDDHKISFNQHQSLSGEIPPHFDINNLSVALKLTSRRGNCVGA